MRCLGEVVFRRQPEIFARDRKSAEHTRLRDETAEQFPLEFPLRFGKFNRERAVRFNSKECVCLKRSAAAVMQRELRKLRMSVSLLRKHAAGVVSGKGGGIVIGMAAFVGVGKHDVG